MPHGWEVRYSKSRNFLRYFFHAETGASEWLLPAPNIQAEPDAADGAEQSATGGAGGAGALAKPNKCDLCEKSYTRPWDLTRHKRAVHENSADAPLSPGGAQGDDPAAKRRKPAPPSTHGGGAAVVEPYDPAKPHSCAFCHKGFTRTSELVRHTRIHTGEKPFTCDLCGQCFALRGNLKSHSAKHAKEGAKGKGPHKLINGFPLQHLLVSGRH